MVRPSCRKNKKSLRRRTIGCVAHQLKLALSAIVVITLVLTIFIIIWRKGPPRLFASLTATVATRTAFLCPPTAQRTLTASSPTLKHTPIFKRVGILAGHSGPQHDPGAVCPDGLREADINLAVAQRVVAGLKERGYEVDLLEEFDNRLLGYRADVFLSIHADSCDIPEATGFKVAHVSFSAIPEIEDALVECLYKEYERITGLKRHDFSITPDMHEYHAFLQIAPETPGAIIELGFMSADRYVLVNQPDKIATGIVAGLLCFLEHRP